MNNNSFNGLAASKNMPILLSTCEFAAYLHKSVRWIHVENSAGRLPYSVKVGNTRFWFADEVVLWLKSKRGGR